MAGLNSSIRGLICHRRGDGRGICIVLEEVLQYLDHLPSFRYLRVVEILVLYERLRPFVSLTIHS